MARNSDTGPIQWDNEGPGQRDQFIPILSPRPHQKLTCLITSERWEGVYTHYFDGRTRPCTGDELHCDGCYRKLARRWKAYLCAVTFGSGRRCIIELTQGAMESCEQIIDRTTNLRGRRIVLVRQGEAKNGPVRCRLEASTSDLFVPPPFNLHKALCVVWGINYGDASSGPGAPPNEPMY